MNYFIIIYHLSLLFCVLNISSLNAQSKITKQDLGSNYGSLCGTVRDTITNIPLRGINCVVDSTSLGAVTNDSGYYYINRIPKGRYKIKYSCVGYDLVIKNDVDIYTGEVKTIDVTMRDYSYFGADIAKQELARGIATIWLGGLIVAPIPDSTFTDIYGFRYVLIGCNPTGEDKHNAIIEEYLERRNGKDWYDKLFAEWKNHANKKK
jgi:hypothetical protein